MIKRVAIDNDDSYNNYIKKRIPILYIEQFILIKLIVKKNFIL